jgi:hypothetical protein
MTGDLRTSGKAVVRIKGLGWDGYWYQSKDIMFNRLDFCLVAFSVLNLIFDVLGGLPPLLGSGLPAPSPHPEPL